MPTHKQKEKGKEKINKKKRKREKEILPYKQRKIHIDTYEIIKRKS